MKLIQDTIDPTTWRDAGGSVGAIHFFDGLLIVTQSSEHHEDLAELLAAMRQKLK